MNTGERYWGDLAGRYEAIMDEVIGSAFRERVFCRVRDLCLKGKALEIGCGTGYFTRALSCSATDVIATDISERMLEKARSRLIPADNTGFIRADCLRLPFCDGSFDTVFMANVIKFIDDPKKAILESHRVLRPGGSLVIVYYSEHSMGLLERADFFKRLLLMLKRPPTFHIRAPVEVKRLVADAGFHIVRDESFGKGLKAIMLVCTKDVKPY